jgi:hypothetical protein
MFSNSTASGAHVPNREAPGFYDVFATIVFGLFHRAARCRFDFADASVDLSAPPAVPDAVMWVG